MVSNEIGSIDIYLGSVYFDVNDSLELYESLSEYYDIWRPKDWYAVVII